MWSYQHLITCLMKSLLSQHSTQTWYCSSQLHSQLTGSSTSLTNGLSTVKNIMRSKERLKRRRSLLRDLIPADLLQFKDTLVSHSLEKKVMFHKLQINCWDQLPHLWLHRDCYQQLKTLHRNEDTISTNLKVNNQLHW